MGYRILALDGVQRARAKQESRDSDRRRLESGEVSRLELTRKNSFFASLDMKAFRLGSIGRRRVGVRAGVPDE